MCGVVGVISTQKPVAGELYDSLIHLQHRGQDAAGIMTYNKQFHVKKGTGLIRDIFDEQNMARLSGKIGVGHTRYPTVGGFSIEEAQPVMTTVPYGIAMAHNGNLVNYTDLVKEVSERDRRHVNSSVDIEVILHIFAHALDHPTADTNGLTFFDQICHAVEKVFDRASGAYSVVGMIMNRGMVIFRDPHGIRPLTKGERKNADGSTDYIFASETTMFYALGYEPAGQVAPGEVIFIEEDGTYHNRILRQEPFTPCIFEYVYFSRPDSIQNDVSVYRARLRMGQNLAKLWTDRYPDVVPDIVIPAPSTANTAALSFAHELGVRYSEGLYKNPFIGRTFIMPGNEARKKSVRYKLVPQELEIRDKKVLILDDSIVRGNTSRQIVRMVREFGAKEVYFVSACPPVKFPCFYGVDMPTKSELTAATKTVAEIQQYMGVNILMYQEIDDLVEAVTRRGKHNIDHPCMACLNGCYVTNDVDETMMETMENQRTLERAQLT
ncbi:MAG: amidophosphoribosyltransferase [Candidatus Marinimicrobia bacterium]|jgi:amidophosphoribosyltransferase|nr:amidophosphoribosyltransferase [Candidatus Neomarinimicrobiota bacterium]MDP6456180.1 amidophosphoribosyltransferase [Candidatus Neomarinimicrobiota bacterium]MDP6592816.1 amidophosphoribosyltransferase [Candidatus Neomarinimicrobiota bacterium]MDP6836071.1 amidophosphoribosyltransferase [Candidatus Neomarinimicrobiota bacterium]MDP6965704.1 amidophosphoribosyltransferase [Candidatus Neomarinimicrobiota bacterium]|tara:strand:+ start:1838 stop:3319 length:1482 start_codon:yes stop_codon:yes gene_type:complete